MYDCIDNTSESTSKKYAINLAEIQLTSDFVNMNLTFNELNLEPALLYNAQASLNPYNLSEYDEQMKNMLINDSHFSMSLKKVYADMDLKMKAFERVALANNFGTRAYAFLIKSTELHIYFFLSKSSLVDL